MVKSFITALCLIMLLGVASVQAAEISFTPQTEVEAVFDRDITLDNTGTSGELSQQFYTVGVGIGLGDNIVIMPKIGIADNKFQTSQWLGTEIEAEVDAGLALGIGADIDIYTIKDTETLLDGLTFSLNGEYMYSLTEVDTIDIGGVEIKVPIRNDVKIHQWEVAALVSLPIGAVTPYAGVAYSDLVGEYDFNLGGVNLIEDIDANDNWGARLGLSAEPITNLIVSVDIKLFDQNAIGGRVAYQF